MALDESWIAKAVVAAVGVDASSVGADAFFLALVSVFAGIGFGISGFTLGALAGEGSRGVDAFSALAEAWYRLAFVDI